MAGKGLCRRRKLESYAEMNRGTDGFWEEYGRMEQRCDELEKELKQAKDRLRMEHLHVVQLAQFRREMSERGTLEEFDEELFELAIEYIMVYRDVS